MSKEIQLRGKDGSLRAITDVDDDDYETLAAYRWYLRPAGYAARQIWVPELGRQQTILMHRELCGLSVGDTHLVDHIDRNKLNNCRSNLRVVDRAGNAQNYPKRREASSIYRGVSWHKGHQKWAAYGQVDKVFYRLGEYDDEEIAGQVAREWRKINMPRATD